MIRNRSFISRLNARMRKRSRRVAISMIGKWLNRNGWASKIQT